MTCPCFFSKLPSVCPQRPFEHPHTPPWASVAACGRGRACPEILPLPGGGPFTPAPLGRALVAARGIPAPHQPRLCAPNMASPLTGLQQCVPGPGAVGPIPHAQGHWHRHRRFYPGRRRGRCRQGNDQCASPGFPSVARPAHTGVPLVYSALPGARGEACPSPPRSRGVLPGLPAFGGASGLRLGALKQGGRTWHVPGEGLGPARKKRGEQTHAHTQGSGVVGRAWRGKQGRRAILAQTRDGGAPQQPRGCGQLSASILHSPLSPFPHFTLLPPLTSLFPRPPLPLRPQQFQRERRHTWARGGERNEGERRSKEANDPHVLPAAAMPRMAGKDTRLMGPGGGGSHTQRVRRERERELTSAQTSSTASVLARGPGSPTVALPSEG